MPELDGFRDHCGVVGIWGHPESAKLTYLALYALQHRGQDSAGIVSKDGDRYQRHVGLGLVNEVFDENTLAKLSGPAAIGHVRYTTAGSSGIEDAQPILVKTGAGHFAVAHNGNLVRAQETRLELEKAGAIFRTSSDTELFCHYFAKSNFADPTERIRDSLSQAQGAFSLCMFASGKLVAARDSFGVRPLVLGKLGYGFAIASEDCAFGLIGAERIRELEPGELVVIDDSGLRSFAIATKKPEPVPCIFEHVYFARPDSNLFGMPVHQARKKMGQLLAKECPAVADAVIAVPDSGVIAAMGFAAESKIPYELGLVRNHYVGRTFIEPETKIRDFGVRLKLCPIEEVVSGRRLVVVDDSLVRGTTSRKIVNMLRACGAKEIHLRIAAPRTTHPCFYGIDTPNRAELIASTQSTAQIADYLHVDSLGYLSLEALHEAMRVNKTLPQRHCDACFSGNYPIPL